MEVHRCQFIEYVPEAVHCMAFNDDSTLLAVSRANGDIELWSVKHDWLLERVRTMVVLRCAPHFCLPIGGHLHEG